MTRLGTILIIDDTPDTISMIRSILEEREYLVLFATTGEKGVQRAISGRPDLILLDVLMPGIDGYETCRLLKGDPVTADIPVIFLSGQTDPKEKIKGFEIGAVDYLEKPVSSEEMMARIHAHLSISLLRQDLKNANTRLEERVQIRTSELRLAYESLEQKEKELRQKYDDLKQKEWELRLSEHRKRTLVRAIPDIVFISTIEGEFLDYHLPEGHLNWHPDGDIIGKNIRELGLQPDIIGRFLDSFQTAASSRMLQHFVYEQSTPEGIKYSDVRILAINRHEILGIVRDITHQLELERSKGEALIQIERIMEQMQTYNDHIRNPLTILACLIDTHDHTHKDDMNQQIKEIDSIIDQVDKGFIESEKVRRYMKRNYFE